MPAHVTVLYPFRSVIDGIADAVVAGLAADVPAFDVTFASLARFPGEVVYLAPDPAEPFLRLMAAAFASFPDCPPYGGAVPDPVPHLTVADGVDVTAAALDTASDPGLPITSRVDRLTLIAQDPNWPTRSSCATGRSAATPDGPCAVQRRARSSSQARKRSGQRSEGAPWRTMPKPCAPRGEHVQL